MNLEQVIIRPAEVEEIIDLRHVVLRAGLGREAAIFAGDAEPTARHYGAFLGGRAVCCATVHSSTWQDCPAWQLRGMATADGFRGRGLGARVLELLESDLLAKTTVRQLWANARVPAIGFYQRLGWQIVSEEFDIPTAGPHRKIAKTI